MDLNPKGPELYKLVKDPKQEPRTLTSGDPRLQQVTDGGNTILHVAANFKNTKAATKILDLDLSLLCKTNKKGDTPMHIAARLGCLEMVELLIKRKEDVKEGKKLLTTENSEKDTALHVAVRKGHLRIVELLTKEDKTLAMMINEAKESPLFLAVDREFYSIASVILDLQQCSVQGRKKMNALHAAVIRTHKSKSPQYIACLLPSSSLKKKKK